MEVSSSTPSSSSSSTTRIGIVFDRLRTEEKMLQKEAERLGYTTVMIDAKAATLDTQTTDLDVGDVVLERCVSYFRGLHFTSFLEFLDIPVINTLKVASTCGDKMFMTLKLQKAGVPTPRTHFTFSAEGASNVMEMVGYPKVIKPVIGSWGRGVIPIHDKDTLDAILEMRGVTDGPHDRIYYLQDVIKRPPRDIRVITVNDIPIAAMYRKSESGAFRVNLALDGNDPQPCPITNEMEDLAVKASKAVGGGILGIDMMEDEYNNGDSRLVVHEVNNTVEFKGLSKVSRKNIPEEMLKFAVQYIRK